MYRNPLYDYLIHTQSIPSGTRLRLSDRLRESSQGRNIHSTTYFSQLKYKSEEGRSVKFHTTQTNYVDLRKPNSLIRSVGVYGLSIEDLESEDVLTVEDMQNVREISPSSNLSSKKFYRENELVYVPNKRIVIIPVDDDLTFRQRSLILCRLVEKVVGIKSQDCFELYSPPQPAKVLSFHTVPPTQREF